MLNTWLARHVPHLVQLASLPFDRATHEEFFAALGWTVVREDWYPETCFEIHFDDVGRRLVGVYEDDETGLGVGLYALTGSPENRDYYVGTRHEFDSAFNSVLGIIAPLIDKTTIAGTYDCGDDKVTYHYAYWGFRYTFMALVQHCEGDGHCGHEASLDIRLVPRLGAEQLAFPLTTNILF